MHTLQIVRIDKVDIVETGATVLSVLCDVKKVNAQGEMEVVGQLRHGFPLDATREEIEETMTKVKEAMDKDAEVATAAVEREAAMKKADETIMALEGQTI